MPEHEANYYFDTVTVCNFALANRLDLLIARYDRRVQIIPTVLDEVMDGIAAGYNALQEIETAVIKGAFGQAGMPSDQEREIFRVLLRALAPGEASCIAYAQNRGGIVVTDDKAARACCLERDVKFTGIIGILKACCQNEMMTPPEADAVLQKMVDVGYFSPVRNISGLL